MELPVGSLLGGRYQVTRPLASGGMGAVYAVHCPRRGYEVAAKVLHRRHADHQKVIARFQREAQLLDAIQHPGVVRVLDSGLHDDGRLFLIMELLQGETLLTRLERGSIPPLELCDIADGIAAALSALHSAGLVHRDLKPSNVFLAFGSGPTGWDVKLIDFGVARAIHLSRLTARGEILGTPRFMAPEQLRTPESVDHRADVFAMGVLAYTALCGHPPYPQETPAAIAATLEEQWVPLHSRMPNAPPELASVIEACLRVDPNLRPATVEAFASRLRACVETGLGMRGAQRQAVPKTVRIDSSSPPPAPSPPTRSVPPLAPTPSFPPASIPSPRRRKRRWPVLAATGSILLVLGALGGAVAYWGPGSFAPPPSPVGAASAVAPGSQPEEEAPSTAPSPSDDAEPVPPLTETPEQDVVTIVSEPELANVFRDGAIVGSTPFRMRRPETEVRLTVALPGYESVDVLVGPDSRSPLRGRLVATPRQAEPSARRRRPRRRPARWPEAEGEPEAQEESAPASRRDLGLVCPFPEDCP